MKFNKLAIASAIALMGMGSVYAQQTTVTTTNSATSAETAGLMTTLSNSLTGLFNAGRTAEITAAVPATETTYAQYNATTDLGKVKYVYVPGTDSYRVATVDEIAADTTKFVVLNKATIFTPQATTFSTLNPVDITALSGAVNLAAINGGINITGTNVALAGATAAASALSTTVIGAMNSSTLDIAKMTVSLSDKTTSKLDIAGLANQGAAPSITTQSFGVGQLGLATTGSTILDAAAATTNFNMTGLASGTDTLASSVTDKLQSMNVFNMALNMAPLVAGVNIAATVDPKAWFLNPQTGIVNLSGVTMATTAIGAMNSSLTHLGAKF